MIRSGAPSLRVLRFTASSRDEPIVWYQGSGTTNRYFLAGDERGSIIAVSDSAGTVVNINSYDEFGIPTATNTAYRPRFAYTGQTWYPEIGLYNYKARWYSPTLGRFMQTDPIGYGDGLNWYNYAHGDPVNASDPSGLDCDPDTGDGCEGVGITGQFTAGGGDPSSGSYGTTPDGTLSVTFVLSTGGSDTPTNSLDNISIGWDQSISSSASDFGSSFTFSAPALGGGGSPGGSASGSGAQQSLRQGPAPRPTYCNSHVYQIGSFISSVGNGIGYLGGAFDVAAAGTFVGSGGIATPGSAALAGTGVGIGIVGSAVGLLGEGVKALGGDQTSASSALLKGVAAGLPLGSQSAKEAFVEGVAGFVTDQAMAAATSDPCD